jgi:hypothetical protein
MHWMCNLGNVRDVYIILVGKCLGKRPLGRLKEKNNSIKMDLKKISCKDEQ